METVLIVEDDRASRDSLVELVETDNRAVVTAENGREALDRSRATPRPALILLDLYMPEMNGWEFLQIKTRDPNIAGIPTIVLSGSTTDLPAGAKDLVAKPVDVGRLLALIDRYC